MVRSPGRSVTDTLVDQDEFYHDAKTNDIPIFL